MSEKDTRNKTEWWKHNNKNKYIVSLLRYSAAFLD